MTMEDRAGSRYELKVKSGGSRVNVTGGGMIGAGAGGYYTGGFFRNFSRRIVGRAGSGARQEALAEGEVQIYDGVTQRVVWEYKPDHLPMGMDESKFIEGMEQDLE